MYVFIDSDCDVLDIVFKKFSKTLKNELKIVEGVRNLEKHT